MLCSLWQRRQQIAGCAGTLPLRASFSGLHLPSHTPQTHTNFHSLRVWKTLGTSNRCSYSPANSLPPARPPLAPHSLSLLRHSQDLGSEKEGCAEGLLRSLHRARAAVFLSPRFGGFVPISCLQLLSCQFCSARLLLPFTMKGRWRKLSPQLAFPNNAHSPQFRRV